MIFVKKKEGNQLKKEKHMSNYLKKSLFTLLILMMPYMNSLSKAMEVYNEQKLSSRISVRCSSCHEKAVEFYRAHGCTRFGPRLFSGKPSKCFNCGTKEFFTEDIPIFFTKSVPNFFQDGWKELPVIRGCVQIHRAETGPQIDRAASLLQNDFINYCPRQISTSCLLLRSMKY